MKYPTKKASLNVLMYSLLALLLISIIILSGVPPVSRDALTHHLAVPKLYIKHGGMYEIPSLKFSYYPMNLDLLYIVPLYFGNDIVPKFIHFAFALLTAWLVFSYLKKRIDTVYALAGALFFLSLPVILKLSTTVYVDLGLIFFSTWSLLYLLRWMENNFKFKYLIISAIACGLALGTKYNGLIVIFLLAFFVPYLFAKYHRNRPRYDTLKTADFNPDDKSRPKSPTRAALIYGAGFVIIALVVFSPWMIRNYIWTNNPLYPLYNGWFNPAPAGMAEASSGGLGHFAVRKLIFKEPLWQTLLIPVRIFLEGQDDLPQYFDGKLNPFLLFLPFFAFANLKNDAPLVKAEKKILLAFAVLYLLFAFFKTDMRIRYIAPIIPALVILATYGLHRVNTWVVECFSGSGRRWMTVCISTAVAVMFGLNGMYLWGQFKIVAPLSYLNGRLNREAYISRYRPEYPTIKYANDNLSNESRILGLFLGNRLYYSDRDLIFGDGFFRSIVNKAELPQNILESLKQRNITHLIIRYDMLNAWSHRQTDKRRTDILLRFFKNHTHRLFSKGGYGLYQL